MSRSRENWERLVDELKQSGMSQVQFARRRGVALSTLQYWLRKLRDESGSKDRRSRAVKFLPVRVTRSAIDSQRRWEAEVGTVRLRFEVGTDVAYVAALLERLGG
jgi:transposase-like protein